MDVALYRHIRTLPEGHPEIVLGFLRSMPGPDMHVLNRLADLVACEAEARGDVMGAIGEPPWTRMSREETETQSPPASFFEEKQEPPGMSRDRIALIETPEEAARFDAWAFGPGPIAVPVGGREAGDTRKASKAPAGAAEPPKKTCELCGKPGRLKCAKCCGAMGGYGKQKAESPAPIMTPPNRSETVIRNCGICQAEYEFEKALPSTYVPKHCPEHRGGGLRQARAAQLPAEPIAGGPVILDSHDPAAFLEAPIEAPGHWMTKAKAAAPVADPRCRTCGRPSNHASGLCGGCRPKTLTPAIGLGQPGGVPVVADDQIVGDGTGGLERGRVYQRTVLAPAGWANEPDDPEPELTTGIGAVRL